PAHYYFAKLTPVDVINLLETVAGEYQYWNLQIQKHEQSLGHQLALLFEAKHNKSRDLDLLVIAQASTIKCGTNLWLKSDVPGGCCADKRMVKELSDMVQYALDVLYCTDAMLAPRTCETVQVTGS